MIATRTKAALAAAKVRGVALGGPKLAVAKHTCRGDEQGPSSAYAADVLPVIREIRRAGAKSLAPNRRCSERSRDHLVAVR